MSPSRQPRRKSRVCAWQRHRRFPYRERVHGDIALLRQWHCVSQNSSLLARSTAVCMNTSWCSRILQLLPTAAVTYPFAAAVASTWRQPRKDKCEPVSVSLNMDGWRREALGTERNPRDQGFCPSEFVACTSVNHFVPKNH